MFIRGSTGLRIVVTGALWIFVSLGASIQVAYAQSEPDYAIGADLSFLAAAEARGTKFKDAGVVKPGLQIFRDHGYNWIRLRLFHAPTQLPNDLPYTLKLAQQAKALGYHFLLDLHYSDTWADPKKQFVPKAWPAPFPQTPEGQREFLDEVQRVVLATPHGLGKGVFWWEPAVMPSPLRSRDMFDDEGNALPVISVFDRYTRGRVPTAN